MFFFFFFNDTATTEIYTLSLHDALPISRVRAPFHPPQSLRAGLVVVGGSSGLQPQHRCHRLARLPPRSEEHTSELQSLAYLVCRLLLEKKKLDTVHSVRNRLGYAPELTG